LKRVNINEIEKEIKYFVTYIKEIKPMTGLMFEQNIN
jgi:hypothetical protein